MQNLFSIALFGVLGVLSRYGIDKFVGSGNEFFPWSTFAINIVGSFLAGLVFVMSERHEISYSLQLGLLVGFCGGFTTFSAYALQTFLMFDKDKIIPAISYLFLSPALGVLAAAVPILLLRK